MKKSLVVLTWAWMSAESWFSTFRDSNGLWENYRVEDVATPEWFRQNPRFVLDFYNTLRHKLVKTKPNNWHIWLVDLEKDFDVHIITQNIDNLHEKAWSSHIIHLHWELMKACSTKNLNKTYDISEKNLDQKTWDIAPDWWHFRPFIVWFWEPVPKIDEAIKYVMNCDIFVVIWSSLNVYPAASLLNFVKDWKPIFLIDPKDVKTNRNDIDFIKSGASKWVEILKEKLAKFVKNDL